ncbi:hypothetical protein GQ53DRAFT_766172 [Thozetella sp. PMI_491]|nr:hypothetical protein GQ53DRAFT_766172 [Thozetella sp. PMI_491]
MASSPVTQLTLRLTPSSGPSGTGALTGLAAALDIPEPGLEGGATLFYANQEFGGTFAVEDEAGALRLVADPAEGATGDAGWRAERPTSGRVTIRLSVAGVASDDKLASKGALRQSHGGLVGIGKAFLPRLALPSTIYRVGVIWDLTSVPAGTKAVWTFGEGPELVSKAGAADILLNSVYMVGPVESVLAETLEGGETPAPPAGQCGAYWLGPLPPSLDAVKDFNLKMFPRLSAFFRDEAGSYRVFFSQVPKGLEAQVVDSSSLIQYAEDAKDEADYDLVRLLNRSMISTWAQLDPEDDGTRNDWFTKGFATLYSIYLPYRFGQRTPHYFRDTLNGVLSGYFTSPLLDKPIKDFPDEAGDWYADAGMWLRGGIYIFRMDALSRWASKDQNAGVLRPIDEIIADISVRRRNGEKLQARDWISYIAKWIGEETATQHLKDMVNGEPMYLDAFSTAFEGIDPVEQEVLDFGFDRASLDAGVVSGVVEGSRAAEAGLQNGDVVKWHSRPWLCIFHFQEKFKLKIERDGQEVNIEYWPRGTAKARLWQSYPKESK